jgi:hypothetical protein
VGIETLDEKDLGEMIADAKQDKEEERRGMLTRLGRSYE